MKQCPKYDPDYKSEKNRNQDSGESIVAESNFINVEDEWIIDSGASEHMTYDRSSFVRYQNLANPVPVRFGNKITGNGIGACEIKIRSTVNGQDKILTMKNLLHVPELRRKLISVTAMMNEGAVGSFENNKITIKNAQGSILLVANQVGNLFLDISEVRRDVNLTQSNDPSLWHQRLGHVNERTIENMVKTKSAINMKCDLNKKESTRCRSVDCDASTLGKQARKTFPLSSRERAKKPGERIHVDLCGPIGEVSITGGTYLL